MAIAAAPEITGFHALSPLGYGPTSTIYSAQSATLGRWVALTVYGTTLSGERAQRRFTRSFDVARRLGSHPHVVTMLESGVTYERQPWVAAEIYERGTLQSRVEGRQPMPVDEVLHMGVELAGALETAHRAEVVHGGIHPARVLLSHDGEPALADLGLVPLVDRGGLAALVGPTSFHAPPEVLEAGDLSPATDVYALASTLYAALTGVAPYQRGNDDTTAALLVRILQHDVPPIGRPDVPASVEHALRTALRSEPRDRPARVLAFARELQSCQVELGLPVTEPTVLDVAASIRLADSETSEPRLAMTPPVVEPAPPSSPPKRVFIPAPEDLPPQPSGLDAPSAPSPDPAHSAGPSGTANPADPAGAANAAGGPDGTAGRSEPGGDATVLEPRPAVAPPDALAPREPFPEFAPVQPPAPGMAFPEIAPVPAPAPASAPIPAPAPAAGFAPATGFAPAPQPDDDLWLPPLPPAEPVGAGLATLAPPARAVPAAPAAVPLQEIREIHPFVESPRFDGWPPTRVTDPEPDASSPSTGPAGLEAPAPAAPSQAAQPQLGATARALPVIVLVALVVVLCAGLGWAVTTRDPVERDQANGADADGGEKKAVGDDAVGDDEIVPVEVTAVENAQGVQLDWAGAAASDQVVLVLSKSEAPKLLKASTGTALLVPRASLTNDVGYCFAVTTSTAKAPSPATLAARLPEESLSPGACVRGASPDTIRRS